MNIKLKNIRMKSMISKKKRNVKIDQDFNFSPFYLSCSFFSETGT